MKTSKDEETTSPVITSSDSTVTMFKSLMMDKPEIISVEWTHRCCVKDDEYIPHGEEVEPFLKCEITKPIIFR